MSGIAMIMDIAKGALAAQSYGLDVTAHNIANVNTEGYSRQRAVFETNDPYQFGGALLGRGTNVSDVVRVSDQFIDTQVGDQKADLSASRETKILTAVSVAWWQISGTCGKMWQPLPLGTHSESPSTSTVP